LNEPHVAPKLKRGFLWALGALGGLAFLGALLDPNAGNLPPPDPNQPDGAKVDGLRRAMKPIGKSIFNSGLAIPADTRPIDLEAAAKGHCTGKAICSVYGWSDPAQLPQAEPLLGREVAAMVFRYDLNRNTDFERTQWFCGSAGAKPDCVKAGAE
jgi:hypothetical protein